MAKFCHKCKTRLYRANNPIRYAFGAIKDSAKKRGIPFNIAYSDFETWCNNTGYATGKGVKRLTDHCDRIRDDEGYHIGNIQLLSQGDNIRKQRERERQAKEDNEPF
jgi:hypothetical protein